MSFLLKNPTAGIARGSKHAKEMSDNTEKRAKRTQGQPFKYQDENSSGSKPAMDSLQRS